MGVVGCSPTAVRCRVGSGASVNEWSSFIPRGCFDCHTGVLLAPSRERPGLLHTLPHPGHSLPALTAFTRRGQHEPPSGRRASGSLYVPQQERPLGAVPRVSGAGREALVPVALTLSQNSEPPPGEVKDSDVVLLVTPPEAASGSAGHRSRGVAAGAVLVPASVCGEGACADLILLCSPFSLP